MAENPIKYSELIQPDDSIEKLISQLTEANDLYTTLANNVKKGASEMSASLKGLSGATEEGRKSIKNSTTETDRLQQEYKKLEQAMAANAKEIERLKAARKQMTNYQKMVVQRGQEEIRTMEQIKNASYKQLSAQYNLNKAVINSLTLSDRRLAKNRELIKSTREIYEQMKQLQAETGKMQLNVGNYPNIGGMISRVGMLTVGIGTAAAAGTAAIGVLKSNIETAKDYEYEVSVLAAILGTTKDRIKELTEQQLDLGATTVFTAKEVAQLHTELAKLGYSVQDILNMAPSVLSFAQATGSSLADAASLTGAALRMFDKSSEDTAEVVDKMTASTTKSALSFSYLQNALSTVSPVANAFGFKIEDVLALLGQLANAGFDASSAATATRNILLNLADANGDLAKALGEPVKDLDGLVAGLDKLNKMGIDLASTLQLTDKRSVAAFNTFLQGTQNVLNLRNELNNSNGAAQQMAKTMGDNLAGSLKSLSSAWEGLNLHLNTSNGFLRDMVDWLTDAVRWTDRLLQKIGSLYGSMDRWNKKQKETEQTVEQATQNPTTNQTTKPTTNSPFKLPTKPSGKPVNNRDKELREQELAQQRSLELRRKYEDLMLELIDDEEVKERTKIIQNYDRQIEDLRLRLEKEKNLTAADKKVINDEIVLLEQVKQDKLADIVEKGAQKQKQIEERRQREAEQMKQRSERENERIINIEYQTQLEEIDMLETSEKEKTRLRLEAEKERLQKLLALYQADGKKLSDEEKKLIQTQIKGIDVELKKNKARDMYDALGFNLTDEKKEAISSSFNFAIDQLHSYMDAWVQAAEAKAQLAEKEVERAQNVLDAEVEARNQGYASDVETARKELELAKSNQEKALKEKEKAQKAQLAMQTVEQAANLITATSLIWSQLGFPWAIPAIAVMWGSFAVAKIKALEATKTGTEEYGEGTVEMLEGGSHQSGNDIDFGRKPDGTRRRAEGGEFFAVINKRNSRKYRKVIPDIIHSLNAGTFEQKYMHAYDGAEGMAISVQQGTSPDLRGLSSDVKAIREQGDRQAYTDSRGTHTIYKNLHRIYKN